MTISRHQFPESKIEYWHVKGHMSRPIEERIEVLNAGTAKLLRDFMNLFRDDVKDKFHLPKPVHLSPDLRTDITAAIEGLPKNLKEVATNYLGALIFVRNIRSNGFAIPIVNKNYEIAGSLIYLNIDKIDVPANEWWTKKEISPYRGNFEPKAIKLEARIDHERLEENTRIRAFQLILAHELGHAIHAGRNYFPRWDIPQPNLFKPGDHPYLDISWKNNGNNKSTLNNEISRDMGHWVTQLNYFITNEEDRKLHNKDMWEVFQSFHRKGFATPYALTRANEDFCELMMIYNMCNIKTTRGDRNLQPSFTIKNPKTGEQKTLKLNEIIQEPQFKHKLSFIKETLKK